MQPTGAADRSSRRNQNATTPVRTGLLSYHTLWPRSLCQLCLPKASCACRQSSGFTVVASRPALPPHLLRRGGERGQHWHREGEAVRGDGAQDDAAQDASCVVVILPGSDNMTVSMLYCCARRPGCVCVCVCVCVSMPGSTPAAGPAEDGTLKFPLQCKATNQCARAKGSPVGTFLEMHGPV
jgi:hypothetical protein